MRATDFWSDTEHAKKVSKQAAELHDELSTWEGLLRELDELRDISTIALQENDDSLHDDLTKKLDVLERKFDRLEFATLFSDDYDNRPAIVSIHAGSGGTEAQDWTEMLMRMLVRFAERREWRVGIVHESRAEDVVIKSVKFRVEVR